MNSNGHGSTQEYVFIIILKKIYLTEVLAITGYFLVLRIYYQMYLKC